MSEVTLPNASRKNLDYRQWMHVVFLFQRHFNDRQCTMAERPRQTKKQNIEGAIVQEAARNNQVMPRVTWTGTSSDQEIHCYK